MSQVQKIIKYLAVAFAFLLSFSIISAIAGVVLSIGSYFNESSDITENLKNLSINADVVTLNIDVKSVKVTIKEGENLSAQTNNGTIKVEQNDNKLLITQKKVNRFYHDNGELIIYVPSTMKFDAVSLSTGAGDVTIDSLSAKELFLELGAGKVSINKLIVSDKTKINGGAGAMTITSSDVSNLDLNIGVGSVAMTSSVKGNSKIDSGVGQIDLNLIGTTDDYRIYLKKGLGSSTIDGKNMSDNSSYGAGNNLIDIDGGVGNINVNFTL